MKTIAASLIAIVSAVCVAYSAPTQTVETYEIVIANGRVIDPDSSLDAVRHVGISGGIIRAQTEDLKPGPSQATECDRLLTRPRPSSRCEAGRAS